MLIARVHVSMEVRRVRGQQYKYSGHVVSFLQNVAKVYRQLPRLPRDLDIVMLKPSNAGSDTRLSRQFVRDFRVRQSCVRQWLFYLKYHRGYHVWETRCLRRPYSTQYIGNERVILQRDGSGDSPSVQNDGQEIALRDML